MPFFNIVMVDDQVEQLVGRISLADLPAAQRVARQHLTQLVDAAFPSVFESALQVKVSDDRGMLLFMLTAFVTEAPAMNALVGDSEEQERRKQGRVSQE